MSTRTSLPAGAVVALMTICACSEPQEPPQARAPSARAHEAQPDPASRPRVWPRVITVSGPDDLRRPPEAWAAVTSLHVEPRDDAAFDVEGAAPSAAPAGVAAGSGGGQPTATSGTTGGEGPPDPCAWLDLSALAARAPALTSLHVRGCAESLASGLPAFGSRLSELSLSELPFEPRLAAALAGLTGLSHLTLEQVTLELSAKEMARLRALPITHLVLRDLAVDSPLADLSRLWSDTLRELSLEGRWAGYRALTPASRATHLTRLDLAGTRIGNYALNQIRGLATLRELDLTGPTFNDHTPLYLRALPLTRVRCTCPNLGDLGLTHLRRVETLETLELERTRVNARGLAELARLPALSALVFMDREVDQAGAAAIGAIPSLTRLTLRGAPVEDPRLSGLAGAAKLRTLVLRAPNLGDPFGPTLAHLSALVDLDLAGTRVSDDLLPHLENLVSLTRLSLARTRVTRRLAPLAALTELRELDLSGTELVDEALSHLAKLPHLSRLDLRGTLVTAAGLAHLAQMPALADLDVRDTVVTAGQARAALGHRVGLELRAGPARAQGSFVRPGRE